MGNVGRPPRIVQATEWLNGSAETGSLKETLIKSVILYGAFSNNYLRRAKTYPSFFYESVWIRKGGIFRRNQGTLMPYCSGYSKEHTAISLSFFPPIQCIC